MKNKIIQYSYITLITLLTLLLFFINTRMYYDVDQSIASNLNDKSEIISQLKYLKASIQSDAAEEMQNIFPEGYFFTYLLYGLTWAEICDQTADHSEIWNMGQKEAYWALGNLDSDYARQIFDKDLDPPYGAFYVSWRTWLRGMLLKSQNIEERDSIQIKTFYNDCYALGMAFEKKGIPFIETYHNATWPADFLIGIAALKLHDIILEPKFTHITTKWIEECKKHLDPETGLIPHSVNSNTGYTAEGARGSSQSLMIRFLYLIDKDFALEQYLKFKKRFVTSFFGLPCVREYPDGVVGSGDVDSGPVIFGIGASATIVSLGTAKTFNDFKFYQPLEQILETLGLPLTYNSQKRYLFGYLPIGDAFLAWSKITRPIAVGIDEKIYEDVVYWWWRIPFHILSLLIIILILLPVYFSEFRIKD